MLMLYETKNEKTISDSKYYIVENKQILANARNKGDNPTIGVILCSDKEDAIVKFSFLQDGKQLFVSKYKSYLPTEKELADEIERQKDILRLQVEKEKTCKNLNRKF